MEVANTNKDTTLEDYKAPVEVESNSTSRKWLNIKAYTANAAFIIFILVGTESYVVGTFRTLEKRFGMNSTEINFTLSMGDIMNTVIVVVAGFIGGKIHKPRVIVLSMLPVIIGNFMCFSLLFTKKSFTPLANETQTVLNGEDIEFCHGDIQEERMCSAEDHQKQNVKYLVYIVLLVANLLRGIGSTLYVLGLAYADENVKKEESSLYIGILMSMFAWGPLGGFSLASLTTSYPEDLSGYIHGEVMEDTDDPNFIGCWWLGYIIVNILLVIAIIPMGFFPKHMPYYHESRSKIGDGERQREKLLKDKLKEFPRLFWKLISNVSYLMVLLSAACVMYIVAGLMVNMTRYIEIHFQQPAYKANMFTGVSVGLSVGFGNLLGGFFMKKFKIEAYGAAKMFIITVLSGILGIGILMTLGCPQPPMSAKDDTMVNSLDLTMDCNRNCSCGQSSINPICDGKTNYLSPCYAGCQVTENLTLFNCSCIEEDVIPTYGMCQSECSMLIPYMSVFFIVCFLSSVGIVPAIMLKLWVVDDELKTLALGISSAANTLLAFVPGVVLYGKLIDSSCLVWRKYCDKRGDCLFYNLVALRLLLHGTTLGIQIGGLVFAVFLLILVYRSKAKEGKYETTCD